MKHESTLTPRKSWLTGLNRLLLHFHPLTWVSGLISSSNAGIAPEFNTKSRAVEPSPAMLPRAHTACSVTCIYDEPRSCTSFGTAPCFTTLLVCSDVPDAMFVSTHEASNCKDGLKHTNGFPSTIWVQQTQGRRVTNGMDAIIVYKPERYVDPRNCITELIYPWCGIKVINLLNIKQVVSVMILGCVTVIKIWKDTSGTQKWVTKSI